MNTVEERLARYRYQLEATTDAEHTDDVRPAGNPRPDGRRALALLSAAALVVVGLVVLNNRSVGHTPAGSEDSSVPTNDGTVSPATAVVDAATTTYTLDPKADVQEPEQWYTVVDASDTVAKIAAMFGLGAGAIAVWNGWTDGESHVLTAGSTVRVPPGGKIVPTAVVPYGSLQVDPNDKPVLVGASNDLTGVCLLTATQIAGCDTVGLPTPPVVARAVAGASATMTLIYGIANAGHDVTIEDRTGTTIGQAVMTAAYHDRRAFAVLVPKTADGHYKVVQTQPDGTPFWAFIIL